MSNSSNSQDLWGVSEEQQEHLKMLKSLEGWALLRALIRKACKMPNLQQLKTQDGNDLYRAQGGATMLDTIESLLDTYVGEE